MITIASRTIRSSPHRDAAETWKLIVDLLTQWTTGDAKTELIAVTGIAASVIADRAPLSSPIVVTCDGPRTRVYCSYDDSSIEESDANEEPLGFDALKGNWGVSLPCPKDDLPWIQAALSSRSSRVTARDQAKTSPAEVDTEGVADLSLTLDPNAFLGQ